MVVPAGQVASAHGVPTAYLWHVPPSHFPLVLQLLVPRSTQVCDGSGTPVGTFVQAPIDPDSAQERHELVQVLEQQTPCAQNVDVHSSPFEQNAPLGFLPHELLRQRLPGEQFASTAQALKHWLPLQANGTQVIVFGATQAPVALQVDSGVKTLFSQWAGAHTVPIRYLRQLPAPSHRPSVPHDDAPWSAHVTRGSAEPAGISVQRPSEDGSEQLRHDPVQASAQHTPSTQKLLAQSADTVHGWPIAFGPQLPFTHEWPATQSSSLVHLLMQPLLAHLYGAQFCTPGVRQVPRPLQVPAVLMRSPAAHDAGTQTVSGAYRAQPPMPSHAPVVPQVEASSLMHWPCGSGFPASVGQQVPCRLSWLQLTQAPVHPTLQQNPSAQKPEPHSLALVHGMPFGFRPHWLLMHRPLLAQSELDRQLVRQAFVAGSQLKGAQTLVGPGRQRPSPSQTLVLVTAAPSHAPALQTVPAGNLRQCP